MCVPALGLIGGLVGSVVSAMGAMQQANAQAEQAEYNAKVAEINARSARFEAASNADKKEDEYQALRGRQTATAGAAGVRLTGSPLRVVSETFSDQYLDTANIIWQGETQGTGYQNKAEDLRTQAKNYRQAGAISAVGSILGGFSKLPGAGSTLKI